MAGAAALPAPACAVELRRGWASTSSSRICLQRPAPGLARPGSREGADRVVWPAVLPRGRLQRRLLACRCSSSSSSSQRENAAAQRSQPSASPSFFTWGKAAAAAAVAVAFIFAGSRAPIAHAAPAATVAAPAKTTVTSNPFASAVSKLKEFTSVTANDKLPVMSYTEMWDRVGTEQVHQATLRRDGHTIELQLKDGSRFQVEPFSDPLLLPHLLDHGVRLVTQKGPSLFEYARTYFFLIYPLIVLYNILQQWDQHQYQKAYEKKGRRPNEFNAEQELKNAPVLRRPLSDAEAKLPENKRTTFKDVAGIDSVMPELRELIDYLEDPDRYFTIGARVPKGVLLVGPPGCGKTLIARALAGETNRAFIPLGAPEFVGNYVGVGASRVRVLFNTAKANAPCMVFIDEFDAIACQRGYAGDSRADERENTLNQFLVEMDGFKDVRGITILAATNRPHALDEAITRPGRFDRVIRIPLPTRVGREDILKVHAKKFIMENNVNWTELAYRTAGWTGADLALLLTEAVYDATVNLQPSVRHENMLVAVDKIEMTRKQRRGEERPRYKVKDEEARVLATHEAGHALLGVLCKDYDTLSRITILARNQKYGYTVFIPDDSRLDSGIIDRKYLFKQMVVALGGRVAEQVMLGKDRVTPGAADDFAKVNELATEMVRRCGFSDAVGPVAWKSGVPGSAFLSGDYQKTANEPFSDYQARQLDDEVRKVVEQAYQAAYLGLSRNKHIVSRMVDILVQKRTMTGEEVRQLVDREGGIYFKENEEIHSTLEELQEQAKHPLTRMLSYDIRTARSSNEETNELLGALTTG